MTDLSTIENVLEENKVERHLDFAVNVPCPMKPRFVSEYESFAPEYAKMTGRDLYAFVPSVCGGHTKVENTLRDITAMRKPEQVPDFQMGLGFGDLLLSEYHKRFVRGGLFQQVIDPFACPLTSAPEFVDPCGSYNPIALMPDLLLVDTKKLGDRPVPQRLEDLLDPVYEGCIALPGEFSSDKNDNRMWPATRVLLDFYKRFGEEGLVALKPNIKTVYHGQGGARACGTNDPDAATIYLMPSIFALSAANKGHVQLVWPKDKAPVQVMVLMVRKDYAPENKALLDWLLSERVGRVFSENNLLSTCPGVENPIPEDAEISWLGWEWLYGQNIAALLAKFDEIVGWFTRNWGGC